MSLRCSRCKDPTPLLINTNGYGRPRFYCSVCSIRIESEICLEVRGSKNGKSVLKVGFEAFTEELLRV